MLFCVCDKLPFNVGTYIYTTNVVQYSSPFIYDRNQMSEIRAMYVHDIVTEQYKFLFSLFPFFCALYRPLKYCEHMLATAGLRS